MAVGCPSMLPPARSLIPPPAPPASSVPSAGSCAASAPRLLPVRLRVEPHADPALVPNIGRAEEGLGIGADQHLLAPRRRLEPDRDPSVAALLHGEDLVLHPERGIAPGLFLGGFGK